MKLETDFSGGYRWETVDFDKDIITALKDEEFEPDLSEEKTEGTQNLGFKPESYGETGLKIVYYDSRVLTKVPLKIFELQVLIED